MISTADNGGSAIQIDPAERAAQRLVSKLILLLVIDNPNVTRDDAIAAFREARAQMQHAPIDATTRAVLVAALDSVLGWLDPPTVWH